MASNQIPENEDPTGREEPVIEILNPEQLAQENQALKTKMGVMEAQMAEVMNMMQHLRSGAAAGAAAIVNSEGVVTFVSPPVSAEVITVHPLSGPEVSQSLGTSSQRQPNAQIYPWGMPRNYAPSIADAIPVVTSQPAVVTSSGVAGVPLIHIPSPSIAPPRSSPALAPEIVVNPPSAAYQMGNPAQYGDYYFSPESYPQGQMIESSQPRDRYHLLEERLKAMEAQIHEMMVILQSLKSGAAAEGVVVVGPVGITSFVPPPPQTVLFSAPVPSQQGGGSHKAQGCQYERRTSFDPITMTYTELFNHLTSKNLINTRPMKALQPPFPRSYNANATCSFHENGVGHTVEECRAFKHAVQDLVDAGRISFKQNSSNTTTNPLPGLEKSAANAIESSVGRVIRSAEKVKTPLEVLHAELCKFGVIKRGCTQKEVCADVNCAGACEAFKAFLQNLSDRPISQIGVQDYKDGHGLGYRPTQDDKKRMAEEKREKRSAKLQRREPNLQEVHIYDSSLSIPVCDIRRSFVSAGLLDHNQIAVIGNGSKAEERETGLVRRCLAREKLKNGEAAAFPVTFNSI